MHPSKGIRLYIIILFVLFVLGASAFAQQESESPKRIQLFTADDDPYSRLETKDSSILRKRIAKFNKAWIAKNIEVLSEGDLIEGYLFEDVFVSMVITSKNKHERGYTVKGKSANGEKRLSLYLRGTLTAVYVTTDDGVVYSIQYNTKDKYHYVSKELSKTRIENRRKQITVSKLFMGSQRYNLFAEDDNYDRAIALDKSDDEVKSGRLLRRRKAKINGDLFNELYNNLQKGDAIYGELFEGVHFEGVIIESRESSSGTWYLMKLSGGNSHANRCTMMTWKSSLLLRITNYDSRRRYVVSSSEKYNYYFVSEYDVDVELEELNKSWRIEHEHLESKPQKKNEEITHNEAQSSVYADSQLDQTISVLAVYSKDYKEWAADSGLVPKQEIEHAIAEANTAFNNSKTGVNLELVNTYEIHSYFNEIGDLQDTLFALSFTSDDKILDEVHFLRDIYGADAVFMVVKNSTDTRAGISNENGYTDSKYPFFVIRGDYLNEFFTFSHELGHIFGCGHSLQQDVNPGGQGVKYADSSYGWQWGGISSDPDYVSIMTYNDFDGDKRVDAERVQHFSNPNVQHEGYSTGSQGEADNSLAIRATKGAISQYRVPATKLTTSEYREEVHMGGVVASGGDNVLIGEENGTNFGYSAL